MPSSETGSPILEDHELLSRLRAKDKDALELIVAKYEYPLLRAAYLALFHGSEAEDAVQNTFLAAWQGSQRTSEQTRLRPWLFGILFNQVRKMKRTFIRMKKREQVASEIRILCSADESDDQQESQLENLRKSLKTMPVHQKELIIMRFEQGFSQSDIASSLNIKVGTVKSRLSRAVSELRKRMEAEL